MTMMIRCMAIDDEPLALRQLKAYLEKVPYFEMVGCCRSALEAARLMETEALRSPRLWWCLPPLTTSMPLMATR